MFRKLKMLLAPAMVLASVSVVAISGASAADEADWADLKERGEGQTVYFHAWGGSEQINDYILWAARRVKALYGVNVKHVKVTDTAEVVNQVLAEFQAGKDDNGAVDMVWINGENFARMKENNLLFGPFTNRLPAMDLVDPEKNPSTITDFTIPTDGYEAPWGMAQMVFMYDTALMETPPTSAEALRVWLRSNPGRFTYPAPPDYLGSTFLKQLLLELADDRSAFMQPIPDGTSDTAIASQSAHVWEYLDDIEENLWRSGRSYPLNETALLQLMGDGEIEIAFAFSPFKASAAISEGILPNTVRSYIHESGTISNVHFLAIPFNSSAKPAAMLFAGYLMSPEAQVNKHDPRVWGDPTVLSFDRLSDEQRGAFEALPLGIATLPPEKLSPALSEPHPDWMEALERIWKQKYLN